MSGTYAEPGTQTLRSGLNREQFISECQYCGGDIVLADNGSGRAHWGHLLTGDAQCQLVSQVVA
jgi:hypothetical protein